MPRLFTSESVTEGHPDKVCDQISDAILDEILRQDPDARVAVETLVTTGLVHVAGEITTSAYVEIPQIIRDTIREIGYSSPTFGFDADSVGVSVSIGQQSADIAQGVDKSQEARDDGTTVDQFGWQGAGDQGLMFGYACDDTPELMPLPIAMAHRLSARLAQVRKDGTIDFLGPDGKTQVTIAYDASGMPSGVDTIVVSSQHLTSVNLAVDIHPQVVAHVVEPVLAQFDIDATNARVLVNPTGLFVTGGPKGDAGVTGRKIIVDTYGGVARHGGGAFSGKDPSKVDRSAAYATRWVAKNVVAAGLARRCELQIAYAIGVAKPVGLFVETFGTGVVADEELARAIAQVFDLRPAAIISALDLKRPIYRETARNGHFGRELPTFSWERTDRVDALIAAVRDRHGGTVRGIPKHHG